jgi:hypothetical protein
LPAKVGGDGLALLHADNKMSADCVGERCHIGSKLVFSLIRAET